MMSPLTYCFKTIHIHVDFSNLIWSNFWFLDGNIVIIVGHAAFTVYCRQLQHISIFSVLCYHFLNLKMPLSLKAVHVKLQDNLSDVFYFLSALYVGLFVALYLWFSGSQLSLSTDTLRLCMQMTSWPSWVCFVYPSSILESNLCKQCLNCLDIDWPSTLAGWNCCEQATMDSHGHYMPHESCTHPIVII